MIKKPKSLRGFVNEAVSGIEYSTFEHPIDKKVLYSKLKELLHKDTPFWLAGRIDDRHGLWFELVTKSNGQRETTSIVVSVTKSAIELRILNGEYELNFQHAYHHQMLPTLDIWLDNESFVIGLTSSIESAIRYGNRQKNEDTFVFETKSTELAPAHLN